MQNQLKQFALELGADVIGFCKLPEEIAPHNLCYAVSFGVKLSDAILKTIESAPSFTYFQHYRAANALLDQIAFRLGRDMQRFRLRRAKALAKKTPIGA